MIVCAVPDGEATMIVCAVPDGEARMTGCDDLLGDFAAFYPKRVGTARR